jgi:2-dehydropantoate 2-reductase
MRVVVVGAGGTGGLYGGLLAQAGHEVGFIARGAHLEAIRKKGLRVESAQFGTFSVDAPASDKPEDLGEGTADLVLLAVKTFDLESAAQIAKRALAPAGVVLTLQNGVEAPDQVARIVGKERVLIGTTVVEATISGPGVVSHLSPGHRFTISELEGPPSSRVETLVQAFNEARINAAAAEDGRLTLWQKAAMLIPVATMTAATSQPIGPIRDVPESAALYDQVAGEVAAVATAQGYAVTKHNPEGLHPTMKASMARDFERGRRTELDALTGAIVRLGREAGVPTPCCEVIYALLKAREPR